MGRPVAVSADRQRDLRVDPAARSVFGAEAAVPRYIVRRLSSAPPGADRTFDRPVRIHPSAPWGSRGGNSRRAHDPELDAELRKSLGLDRPLLDQYLNYLPGLPMATLERASSTTGLSW